MINRLRTICAFAAGVAGIAVLAAQAPPAPPQQPPTASGPTEVVITIRGEAGAPPHYAVPDFIPLTTDKETIDAARLVAEVLWNDLDFEVSTT